MSFESSPRTRSFRIIAQDPSVLNPNCSGQQPLTAQVDVPVECVSEGPWGHRVQVIDYDCSQAVWRSPPILEHCNGYVKDRFATSAPEKLVGDFDFHAQNVYAIVMRTLARFEQALGRHVSWFGGSHQIKVVPHAFRTLNAFYARDIEALLFGYGRSSSSGDWVYTCLSHDVIVHETTHALLDSLHERYIDPSSPDQAAFHEGFSDIVALLSVFALRDVVEVLLSEQSETLKGKDDLTGWLKKSALLGLAEQMGAEIQRARGAALRRSVALDPSPAYYLESRKLATKPQSTPNPYAEFILAHRRGEILVAAMMNAFVEAWSARLQKNWSASEPASSTIPQGVIPHWAEEGADAADYLLTMAIRALDYMPPLHIEFTDYLNALITADRELHSDDTRFGFREHLLNSFSAYGIEPIRGSPVPNGTKESSKQAVGWAPIGKIALSYERTHFEPLTRDPDEVFRLVWENRKVLGLDGELDKWSYLKVLSVCPCVRIAPDGFVLRETMAQFYQVIRLTAKELRERGFILPDSMGAEKVIALYGGATLIFDDFACMKYSIHNALSNKKRQSARIVELARRSALSFEGEGLNAPASSAGREVNFAAAHRLRGVAPSIAIEEW